MIFHLLRVLEEPAQLFAFFELSLLHVNAHQGAMKEALNNQVDKVSQQTDVSQPRSVTTTVLAQWLMRGVAMVAGSETTHGFNSIDFNSPEKFSLSYCWIFNLPAKVINTEPLIQHHPFKPLGGKLVWTPSTLKRVEIYLTGLGMFFGYGFVCSIHRAALASTMI